MRTRNPSWNGWSTASFSTWAAFSIDADDGLGCSYSIHVLCVTFSFFKQTAVEYRILSLFSIRFCLFFPEIFSFTFFFVRSIYCIFPLYCALSTAKLRSPVLVGVKAWLVATTLHVNIIAFTSLPSPVVFFTPLCPAFGCLAPVQPLPFHYKSLCEGK